MADSPRKSPIRVIHAPEAVAGNSPGLAAAERSIGLRSEAIALRPHPFGYEGVRVFGREGMSIFGILAGWVRMFFHVLENCDVLHLNFGRSIFDPGPNVLSRIPRWTGLRLFLGWVQRLEFRCYRRRGIAVFVTYQGDDARQAAVPGDERSFSITGGVHAGYYGSDSDRIKQARIRFFAERAERVFYLNPDLARFMAGEAEFLPYASVDPSEWQFHAGGRREMRRIVHAPSHRGVKGTEYVLAARDRLREEGLTFEFVLVEGKSREEARREYEEADLVVDQLLAGWYGGLAVECMALGKPVIAHIEEADLGVIPPAMKAELPFIRATPDTIAEVLREWLLKPVSEFERVGKAGREFVETWHDPRRIATRLKAEYEEALRREP